MLRQACSATQCVESELELRTQRLYQQIVGQYRCWYFDKAAPLYLCNHRGVQIPPKHIMRSIQGKMTLTFPVVSQRHSDHHVYDRSPVYSI